MNLPVAKSEYIPHDNDNCRVVLWIGLIAKIGIPGRD